MTREQKPFMVSLSTSDAGAGTRTSGRRAAGRPAADEPGQPREDMLDAAVALFARHGVAATTIRMVAQHAGYTPAAVHYHFVDKPTLVRTVVEERIGRLMREAWDGVLSTTGGPQATAIALARRLFQVTTAHPWLPSLWMREFFCDGGEMKNSVMKPESVKLMRGFAETMARGVADGSLDAGLDARLVFLTMSAMIMIPLAAREFWPRMSIVDGPEGEALVLRHVETMLRIGLGKP